MPRRRVHRPSRREDSIYVHQHADASDLRSTAPREFLRRLPGGEANRWIDAVRRGRLGPGVYHLEGRMSGESRRLTWVRIVSTDPYVRAPAPVVYGTAEEVALATRAAAPAHETARRADLVRAYDGVLEKLVACVDDLVQRVRVLEAQALTSAACDLAVQRARRLGLP